MRASKRVFREIERRTTSFANRFSHTKSEPVDSLIVASSLAVRHTATIETRPYRAGKSADDLAAPVVFHLRLDRRGDRRVELALEQP